MFFTAFKPGLSADSATVYGCGNNALGNDIDGVSALRASNGDHVWVTEFKDHHVVNVGSCSGITDDIVWGPSVASPSGSAVYIARGKAIQALDSKDGDVLWTYRMDEAGHSKFVVISDKTVLVANMGKIVALETIEPPPPTPSQEPTTRSPSEPTMRPSRSPLATPAPVGIPLDTPKPSSASTSRISYFVAVLSALPLLLVLIR